MKTSPENVYQITVYDEVVAEIRTPPKIKPGEAAARLLTLRKKLGSKNIEQSLYPKTSKNTFMWQRAMNDSHDYFGTSIFSYPLPTPAKNLMRSGFIRITTYLGSDGSL